MKRLSFMNRCTVSRLTLSAGALVIAAGVAAATVPSAADAAVSSRSVAASAMSHGPAQNAANITSLKAATNRKAPVIICRMVFQGANGGLPHHSGHFPGSINVRVRVTCTQPVAKILGYVVLFQISSKGKILRRTSPRKYESIGRGAANGNAALGCKPGYYEGESVALVTFPPRYTPHTGLLRDHTRVAHIGKC